MLQEITLHSGESRHLVLVNESNTDWHIIQESGSSLCIHIIHLAEQQTQAEW